MVVEDEDQVEESEEKLVTLFKKCGGPGSFRGLSQSEPLHFLKWDATAQRGTRISAFVGDGRVVSEARWPLRGLVEGRGQRGAVEGEVWRKNAYRSFRLRIRLGLLSS